MNRRKFIAASVSAAVAALAGETKASVPKARDYHFDRTISRGVLDNYLARSITMQSLFAGHAGVNSIVSPAIGK